MDPQEMLAIDTTAMPWEARPNEKVGRTMHRKLLVQDPDTGMEVRMVRYPAGYVTPWHTHPCAHGMYVLEGTLLTDKGRHGPGSFLWFPEGTAAEHGATPEAAVVALFITNKKFAIQYVDK